jgi:hypothetical protein
MYLFTRRVVVSPSHIRAGMAHAIKISEYVNQNTDLEVSLYQVLQGEPVGTLTFAYRTESFAASLDSVDELVNSDAYLALIEDGANFFVGNAEDQLATFVHIAGEISGPPAAAAAVTASIDVPQIAKATAWSLELADYTSNATGVPVALMSSNYGQYGTVTWISYGQSVAQLEQSQEKLNSDPGFLRRLADSGGLFIAGSGSATLSRKLA